MNGGHHDSPACPFDEDGRGFIPVWAVKITERVAANETRLKSIDDSLKNITNTLKERNNKVAGATSVVAGGVVALFELIRLFVE